MDNIKKIINDCTKLINNKPLTNQHLIDSILTNHPTATIYLFKMGYDIKDNTYHYKNEWFNILLSIFFTPFYSFLFIKDINRKKLSMYLAIENRK